jgi:uncharacterized protein (TIGR03437 family)
MKIRGLRQYWVPTLILAAAAFPATAQPVVTVGPNQVFFNYTFGSSLPPTPQTVTISSSVPITITPDKITITYTNGSGWLDKAGAGATPISLSVIPLLSGITSLAPGYYAATINVDAGVVDPSSSTSIGVFLLVTTSGGTGGPSLTVSPAVLNFSYQPGGAVPASQTVNITTGDSSQVAITSSTDNGANWLKVSPSGVSSTPVALTVSVSPAGLTAGTYSGSVAVSGNLGSATIVVTLTIGTSPFTITPTSLTFSTPQNYGVSPPQYIKVATDSPVNFNAFATSDSNWLLVDANAGTTPYLLGVRVNPGNLAQGSYNGKVTIQQTPSYAIDVAVTMTIGGPALLSIAPASVVTSWQIGDPTPSAVTVKVNSTSTTQQAFTIATNLINGTGWATATAAATTTPATINIALNPTSLSAGTYVGTVRLTPTAANSSPQDIAISLTVTAAPPPVITSVQSAASGAPGTVAPGELVTIIGRGVGPKGLTSFPAGANPVPTTVGNTSVTFDGIAAPVIYASATATTVQVPYNIQLSNQSQIKLTYTTAQSVAFAVLTQAIYPGLFSLDATGKGQAAALNQDFSVNGPGNPAKRGDIIVLYGTGEGIPTPPLATGAIVPLTPPFPQPSAQPIVYFNGQPGKVLYAGEAPGSVAGLFQINVQVPTNIPAGTISVLASFSGQGTQSGLTVSIQ